MTWVVHSSAGRDLGLSTSGLAVSTSDLVVSTSDLAVCLRTAKFGCLCLALRLAVVKLACRLQWSWDEGVVCSARAFGIALERRFYCFTYSQTVGSQVEPICP